MRFILVTVAGGFVLLLLARASCAQAFVPPGTVAAKYFYDGPYSVETTSLPACDSPVSSTYAPITDVDRLHDACTVYYPSDLGEPRPMILWGNGSPPSIGRYAYFLRHLASWGFVIVAPDDEHVGDGQALFNAFNFMLALNRTEPTSEAPNLLYHAIETNEIGAAGHSQGAMGAIAALEWSQYPASWLGARRQDGVVIRTAVAISLPSDTGFCGNAIIRPHCRTDYLPPKSAIFLLSGADDPISPPEQPTSDPGEDSIAAFYAAAGAKNGQSPRGVTKVKATARGNSASRRQLVPSHNDVQGQPRCGHLDLCKVGVFPFLAYPAAWFAWQLEDDDDARTVFVKPDGELFRDPMWTGVDGTAD